VSHPGGRPTVYSEEALKKADDYIKNYQHDGDLVPSAAGMALKIGVNKATLYRWAQDHAEFCDMLSKMNETQERRLLAGGLSSSFNAAITKLMLAKQGYSEKQEIDHTTNGKDMPSSQLRLSDLGLSVEAKREILEKINEKKKEVDD